MMFHWEQLGQLSTETDIGDYRVHLWIAFAAFISCRLDYCDSLLYRLPDTLLR